MKKLYYAIGEVSELTGLKAYVLRYWETEFSQLKPSKNRAGNRTYRQKDIDVIFKIKELLYDKKYTIDGARKILIGKNDNSEKAILEKKNLNDKQLLVIQKIRDELEIILKIIQK
ncbi:MAG: transcriptional regulator [Candidatus Marinimicrobia bacterium]|nr:transcriptional regulator [Candidatus Neomarinimicrobiota bacterium]